MIKTIKIKRKTEKQVNTQRGPSTSYSFLGDWGEGDQWVSVWANAETAGWFEGAEVQMDLSPREYNGKTYWNGKPVPGSTPAPKQSAPQSTEKLDEILATCKAILRNLRGDTAL